MIQVSFLELCSLIPIETTRWCPFRRTEREKFRKDMFYDVKIP